MAQAPTCCSKAPEVQDFGASDHAVGCVDLSKPGLLVGSNHATVMKVS